MRTDLDLILDSWAPGPVHYRFLTMLAVVHLYVKYVYASGLHIRQVIITNLMTIAEGRHFVILHQ
jgi:hypothetical protein